MSSRLEVDLAATGARCQAGLDQAPYDPFEALREFRVAVVRWPLKDAMEGAYTRRDGEAFTIVNSLTAYVRQRFTAAHELGHHILHGATSPRLIVDDNLDGEPASPLPEEQEAGWFATSFLMPTDEVREVARRWPRAEHAIMGVVAEFQVSKEAAARRLVELEVISEDDKMRAAKDRRTLDARGQELNLAIPSFREEVGRKVLDARLHAWAAELLQAAVLTSGRALFELTPLATD
jgi:Zn-dependent peptidase ImmA (M78 family)